VGNVLAAVAVAVIVFSPGLANCSAPPSDPLVSKYPDWHLPQVAEVKAEAGDWVRDNCKINAAQARALSLIAGIREDADGTELLDRLAEAFAAADPGAAQLVDLCSRPRARAVLPSFAWMSDPNTAPILAANMRLYYGRWLVQGEWFDEALEQIGGLKPADVVAPAELLFYQGVAYDSMLNKEQGMKVLNQLLNGEEFTPRRYVVVAMQMQSDLENLKEGTLAYIARQMKDNGRWLNKGQAGPKVRNAEGRIIEALDKLLEERDGTFVPGTEPGDPGPVPGQGVKPGSSLRPDRPAESSTPRAGKAPGNVDNRAIGRKSNWGNLPPKQREEALQQMGKDFPPHYREAIEQYFRKLATEEGDDEDK
jgi:hypothetical protein